MKKAFLFLFSLLAFFAVGELRAGDFLVPKDRDGIKATNIQEVGVYAFMVDKTTDAKILMPGSTLQIYGVLTSTRGDNDTQLRESVFLRSTNTANITSELLVPPIPISTSTR